MAAIIGLHRMPVKEVTARPSHHDDIRSDNAVGLPI
jgi:hypothetical protein